MRTLLLGCLVIFAPLVAAHGTPLLELMDTPDTTRPFGGRSAANDGTSAYFNPARLSLNHRRLSVTYLTYSSNLRIRRNARPDGYDVPASVYQSQAVINGQAVPLSRRPLPTNDLPTSPDEIDQTKRGHSVVIGLSAPIVSDTLSFGFTSIFAVGKLQELEPFFVDERAQYFDNQLHYELYGDRLDVTTFVAALAYRPIESLTIGVGASMLNDSRSAPQVYLADATDQNRALINPQVTVEPVFVPHFGVMIRPMGVDTVELSANVHLPSESRMTGASRVKFWQFEYPDGQDALRQPYDLVFMSEPLRTSLGGRWTVDMAGGRTLELYGDCLWTRWTQYTDRQGDRPSGWSDTVSGRLGLRWQIGAHAMGVGAAYTPSPVPEQNGRTNYVDGHRLGNQLGYRWTTDVKGQRIGFGVGFGASWIGERKHAKQPTADAPVLDEFPDAVNIATGAAVGASNGLQTNNPGFPGFEHDGFILNGRFTLSVESSP
ncbi:MAG: hypothetical protein VX589_14430 [Myxococcota bacterium]|nr:hypothetical protein [Myxococcota bacterium]